MSEYQKPRFSESEIYTILMVREWIEDVETEHKTKVLNEKSIPLGNKLTLHEMIWKSVEEQYPLLAGVKEGEGVYGMRRLSIDIGTVIEKAMWKFDDSEREELLHGAFDAKGDYIWEGVGDFDFELVPKCCEHWMYLQTVVYTMNSSHTVEVTVEQMFDFMCSLFPKDRQPKRSL